MLEQDSNAWSTTPMRRGRCMAVRPSGLAAFLDGLPPAQSRFLRQLDFTAAAQELLFLPGDEGVVGAVLGLGDDNSPAAFGNLAFRLPEGMPWRLQPGDYDLACATLGFCLGAYRYAALKAAKRGPARLLAPGQQQRSRSAAAATWMVRDLVNTPANLLGPVELAEFAASLGKRYGAATDMISGDALVEAYPTVAAVGRGSARPARVAILRWSGSTAHADAPLISLCGKGVCFDTGGYDIKPSSGMLRMKKDMGGAATVLGLARMIMEADLPVRLAVRVGCVENSISGHCDAAARRDPHAQRHDGGGRQYRCGRPAGAVRPAGRMRATNHPSLLVDCATLTGAARVALGPDLPAMFCNDDAWADALLRNGQAQHDPLWRLPLWAAIRPLAGQSGRRSQQRVLEAACRRDHSSIVPQSICYLRVLPGPISTSMHGTISHRPGIRRVARPTVCVRLFAALAARVEGAQPDRAR